MDVGVGSDGVAVGEGLGVEVGMDTVGVADGMFDAGTGAAVGWVSMTVATGAGDGSGVDVGDGATVGGARVAVGDRAVAVGPTAIAGAVSSGPHATSTTVAATTASRS